MIHDFPQQPIGPRTLTGLASWLRKAADARNKVELSPSTARMIADVLDQQANQMMQGRVA